MAVVIGLCGLSPPGSQPTERTFDVIGRDRLGKGQQQARHHYAGCGGGCGGLGRGVGGAPGIGSGGGSAGGLGISINTTNHPEMRA